MLTTKLKAYGYYGNKWRLNNKLAPWNERGIPRTDYSLLLNFSIPGVDSTLL